jgi:hypothetical protein
MIPFILLLAGTGIIFAVTGSWTVAIILWIGAAVVLIGSTLQSRETTSDETSPPGTSTATTKSWFEVFTPLIVPVLVIGMIVGGVIFLFHSCGNTMKEITQEMNKPPCSKKYNQPTTTPYADSMFPALHEGEVMFDKTVEANKIYDVKEIIASPSNYLWIKIKTEKPDTFVSIRVIDYDGKASAWDKLSPEVMVKETSYLFWSGTLQLKTNQADTVSVRAMF